MNDHECPDAEECENCGHIYNKCYLRKMVEGNALVWLCMECAEYSIREQKEGVTS